jgi:hypothetical protein
MTVNASQRQCSMTVSPRAAKVAVITTLGASGGAMTSGLVTRVRIWGGGAVLTLQPRSALPEAHDV